MTDVADADVWRAVAPKGLALGLLVTTISFVILTSAIMVMRFYIRTKTKRLGVDDWVMLAGYILNLGQSAEVIYGCFTGLGTRDDDMTQATSIEGYKILLIWQALYVASLSFIKSSICITLLRITNQKIYIYILRGLVAFSFLLSGSGLIFIFNQCHPLDRYWDDRVPGTCMPTIIVTVLSYAVSVVNVIIDFTVAIIPFFLLRNVQMRSRLKFYVRLILGLGILAGVASIIRVPFTSAYMSPNDVLYYSGNIILWTIVEGGIGIIAGSLPTLRAFFKRLVSDESTQEYYKRSEGTDLVTFGQGRARKGPICETEAQFDVTIIGGGDNDSNNSNHGDDTESTRRIVKVTRDIEQTVSQSDETTLGRN
ncbi:hypothetical protein LZ32DRAFT_692133 [Colletotrichum eremochloae]|nr:hypothetical protein LZ32DRAFT_692133 [Colletotrichum eremochloae]